MYLKTARESNKLQNLPTRVLQKKRKKKKGGSSGKPSESYYEKRINIYKKRVEISIEGEQNMNPVYD